MLTSPFTLWGFIYRLSLFIYIYITTHVLFIHHSSSIVLHQSPITLSIGWLRTWHTSMYKSSTCPPRRSRLPGAESQPSSSNGQDDFESEPVPRRKNLLSEKQGKWLRWFVFSVSLSARGGWVLLPLGLVSREVSSRLASGLSHLVLPSGVVVPAPLLKEKVQAPWTHSGSYLTSPAYSWSSIQ